MEMNEQHEIIMDTQGLILPDPHVGCHRPVCIGAACEDMTGRKFGHLTVVCRYEYNTNDKKPLWVCRCDCGNPYAVIRSTPRLKKSTKNSSCGCMRKTYNANSIYIPPNDRNLRNLDKANYIVDADKKKLPIERFEMLHDMMPGSVKRMYIKGYTMSQIVYVANHHDEFPKLKDGQLINEDGFICLVPFIGIREDKTVFDLNENTEEQNE